MNLIKKMETKPKDKLERIADIWNRYIWEYRFCNSKIKFNNDLRTNYFGDILNYFSDTFSILEKEYKSSSFQENFEHSISFLQAIYIQQDFIEELHFIFKTGISKGDLKKDSNYSINREIRNESIGHPIRKIEVPINAINVENCSMCGKPKGFIKNKEVLLSSILFSNKVDSENIRYLKYHRDNNFQFREAIFSKAEIIKRHYEFLNLNFERIINKLKKILRKFLKKLNEINQVKDKIPMENLIKMLTDSFEYIFKTDYLFKPNLLIKLSNKKNQHKRYEIALNSFYNELEIYLKESIEDIKELLKDTNRFTNVNSFEEKFNVEILKELKFNIVSDNRKENYNYELGKLVNKERCERFNFFISILEDRCEGKTDVISEIHHMKSNMFDDLEYYSAYTYLRKLLTIN